MRIGRGWALGWSSKVRANGVISSLLVRNARFFAVILECDFACALGSVFCGVIKLSARLVQQLYIIFSSCMKPFFQASASKIHFVVSGIEPGRPLAHGQAFFLRSRKWPDWKVGVARQTSTKVGGRGLG